MLDKEKIAQLQKQGLGYRRIAAILNISENTIKSYLKRHPVPTGNTCKCCGVPITNTLHKRERKFCSDRCRMLWWNTHKEQVRCKAFYSFICPQCGASFESYGNKNRTYCSRACYAEARRKDGGENG